MKPGERLYAEHFGPGARLTWPAPPLVRAGAARVPAPSATAVVAWVTTGSACCRFFTAGVTGEPTEVVRNQPCKESQP